MDNREHNATASRLSVVDRFLTLGIFLAVRLHHAALGGSVLLHRGEFLFLEAWFYGKGKPGKEDRGI